jgi:hypothetical protein
MPITIRPVSVENQKLKLLLYGEQGNGKTTLTATAADHEAMSPVLILNIEGGLLSVANRPGIDEALIRTSADMEEIYRDLFNNSANVAKYKTIVIDSGTVYASRAMVEIIQRNMAKASKRGKLDPLRAIDDAQVEDYGALTNQVSRMFAWFRDLDKHVICTALQKTNFPPGDQKVKVPSQIRPLFGDRLGDLIMGMYDHVWYKYTYQTDPDEDGNTETVHAILTQRSGLYIAKTRGEFFGPAIGTVVENPHLGRLYDTLVESETIKFTAPVVESDDEGLEGTEEPTNY